MEKSMWSTNFNNNQHFHNLMSISPAATVPKTSIALYLTLLLVVLQHASICYASSKFPTASLFDLLLQQKSISFRSCKTAYFELGEVLPAPNVKPSKFNSLWPFFNCTWMAIPSGQYQPTLLMSTDKRALFNHFSITSWLKVHPVLWSRDHIFSVLQGNRNDT